VVPKEKHQLVEEIFPSHIRPSNCHCWRLTHTQTHTHKGKYTSRFPMKISKKHCSRIPTPKFIYRWLADVSCPVRYRRCALSGKDSVRREASTRRRKLRPYSVRVHICTWSAVVCTCAQEVLLCAHMHRKCCCVHMCTGSAVVYTSAVLLRRKVRRSLFVNTVTSSGNEVFEILTFCRGWICTGSPRFAPVQFAPIQSNADFETRRSKSKKKKYILLSFITFYNFSRTASYTKS
jgi:hypothetical protein